MIYYNENNPHAAEWLRCLIAEGLIPAGDVDARSISDVQPGDLAGYATCHFFAGIGGWAYAGRLAGLPDDWPWWSGSCPCQPFSVAGKGAGTADTRHLWPDLFRLARACRPARLVGEQVAGKAGRGWFDGVCADLEGERYACRAVDIPACAVNAPHIRQRLYWCAVGDGVCAGFGKGRLHAACRVGSDGEGSANFHPNANAWGGVGDMPGVGRREGRSEPILQRGQSTFTGADARLGHGDGARLPFGLRECGDDGAERAALVGTDGGVWANAEWLHCHDGKARRSQPGLRLLVDGFPGRVDGWRGLGNAIVAPLAAEVLAALFNN